MTPFRRLIHRLDAHHRMVFAVLVALAVYFMAFRLRSSIRAIVTWDAFAFTTLVLCWLNIAFAHVPTSIRDARLQDSSRTAIFLFVIVATVASIFAVGILLGNARSLAPGDRAGYIVLAGLTIALSWCLMHTVFALHYAHIYYQSGGDSPGGAQGEGLAFPQEPSPDFLDFVYFSFVIGMTWQVSDVQITSRRLRRLVLLHGLLAFAFNTVILALSINLASAYL